MYEVRDMRCRGKRVDNNEWVVGYYIESIDNRAFIGINLCVDERGNPTTLQKTFDAVEVIPETVGQFTGGLDKNGVERVEQDIVENECGERGVITFGNGRFVSKYFPPYNWDPMEPIDGRLERQTVLGNIIDNPELLEVSNGN